MDNIFDNFDRLVDASSSLFPIIEDAWNSDTSGHYAFTEPSGVQDASCSYPNKKSTLMDLLVEHSGSGRVSFTVPPITSPSLPTAPQSSDDPPIEIIATIGPSPKTGTPDNLLGSPVLATSSNSIRYSPSRNRLPTNIDSQSNGIVDTTKRWPATPDEMKPDTEFDAGAQSTCTQNQPSCPVRKDAHHPIIRKDLKLDTNKQDDKKESIAITYEKGIRNRLSSVKSHKPVRKKPPIMKKVNRPGESSKEKAGSISNKKKYNSGIKTHSFAKAYARFAKYREEHYSKDNNEILAEQFRITAQRLRPPIEEKSSSTTDGQTKKPFSIVDFSENDAREAEVAFQNVLLECDTIFDILTVPACVWRRTGEIYRANKEFAALVNISQEKLRKGIVYIYELMTEEEVVKYWELYDHMLDSTSGEATLTTTVLKQRSGNGNHIFVPCCCSYTLKRGNYGITVSWDFHSMTWY